MKQTLRTAVVMATVKGLVGICTDKRSNKCYLLLFSLLPGCIEMGRWGLPHHPPPPPRSPGQTTVWMGKILSLFKKDLEVCMLSLSDYLGLKKDSGL